MKISFKRNWGGEDTWYTRGKRWANGQKPPINIIALIFLEWMWREWVRIRVKQEMESVDEQVEEIMEKWEEEDKVKPIIIVTPSEVEGLDTIEIKSPWKRD